MAIDEDIKIYTPPQAGAAADELDDLAAQRSTLVLSGQMEKAKRLGRELAQKDADSAEVAPLVRGYHYDLDAAAKQNLRVLLLFCAQQAIDGLVLPELLADAATAALQTELAETAPAFWGTVSDGMAFTQYLLSLRNIGDLNDAVCAIAGTFARMCGQEDNEDLHGLAKDVFYTTWGYIETRWK
ncbi:MAG: hypothetical protein LBR73_07230 [Oscillospiraceae bacterium]|nr:hypothetical protein [Oscillospiraceae bacterium]